MKPAPTRLSRLRTLDYAPLLTVTLLVVTLFVLVPAHLYLINKSALLVFFSEVLSVTAVVAASVIVAFAGLIALMPAFLRQRITVLILGVSFLLWIHAYCLVWSYAVMDGGDIPWETYTSRSIIDAVLWVGVLGPMLWFAPRIYPRAGSASLGLLVIQLASLGINTVRSYDSPLEFFKHYYVDKSAVFDLSAKKNVIVIVLDEFQSDIFTEAVLPQEKYRKLFAGFTYFPDTTAGFDTTEFAIPAILTGHIYDNGISREEFLRNAYLNDSLPATLKRAGYSVHLYPWMGFANESIYFHEDVASNLTRRSRPLRERLLDVSRLVDLGIFRSVPQFAKRAVHDQKAFHLTALNTHALSFDWSTALVGNDDKKAKPAEYGQGVTLDNAFLGFAQDYLVPEMQLSAREGPSVLKYYHLIGMHVPVKINRDLTQGQFDYTRANFSEQAEAYAQIVGAFLEKLKEMNVYDNSMIIILGDHGSGREPELYTNPGTSLRITALNATAAQGDFQRDKARGIPLLLVKRFGEKAEIKTSRVPASLVDIPATVLAELNIPRPPVYALAGQKDFYGVSLFELQEHQTRTRYYGAMEWAEKKSDFVTPITLYRIQGDSWSDDSWTFVKTMEHKN